MPRCSTFLVQNSANIRRIAVYCSASDGVPQSYNDAAYRLGQIIGEAHIELVYGDGGIGLMRHLADGALSVGGKVIGVIPRFMVERGWNNPRSSETIVTETMHERKATIVQMVDAMVALPGGVGTMEELFECLTWKQLGLHGNPVVILNTNGFYDPVIAALDKMLDEHFLQPVHRNRMFTVVHSPEEVLPAICSAADWGENESAQARTV